MPALRQRVLQCIDLIAVGAPMTDLINKKTVELFLVPPAIGVVGQASAAMTWRNVLHFVWLNAKGLRTVEGTSVSAQAPS